MNWRVGRIPIRLRRMKVTDPYTYRPGLVSEDGHWGLHLDGEHLDLTHMPSGKRLGRFPSLGQAAECAAAITPLTPLWGTVNPQDTLTEIDLVNLERLIASYQQRAD